MLLSKGLYQKERILWIDIAKGYGIFFIVLGHVLRTGVVRQFLYSFHVPFFFILSGLTYRPSERTMNFFKKRFKTILIPYFVFGLISILIYRILAIYIDVDFELRTGILENIVGMFYGNPRTDLMKWNLPLWFLPSLFSTMFIAEILESILDKHIQKQKWLRAVVVFLCLFLGLVLHNAIKQYDIKLPFFLESLFFLLGFFELGVFISPLIQKKEISEKIKKRPATSLLMSLCLILIGLFASLINGSTEVIAISYGSYPILFVVSAISISFGLIIVSFITPSTLQIQLIGFSSLSILLLHKFPILLFQFIIPFTKKALEKPSSLLGFVTSLIVSVLTIFLCLLASKVIEKLLPEILGKKREVE
ncbi:MAG: acyltransferase family protein [Bacillota bacterium]|nr:acyltransferase family protein [Bacillota bacterium]